MIEIKTDGTIQGTQILLGGMNIAPYLTSMEWVHQGGQLVTAKVAFPATVEHLPAPPRRDHALMFGNRKEIEAPQ